MDKVNVYHNDVWGLYVKIKKKTNIDLNYNGISPMDLSSN